MKLSTRSRYGARLLLDLALNQGQGFVQLGEAAKRLGVSMKYLEQIILPLKKKGLVDSVRGAKGGHRLAVKPGDLRVGDVVALLEGGMDLIECARDAGICGQSPTCVTRRLWQDAARAMFEKLNEVTFADLLREQGEQICPAGKG
ncbi:MAG: Rrf2 family transcriptional regulator [Desulfatibacillaceae bacterium]|nr:Rrf2 family transcriptional regulator [Desulfatibacillaceae bacterium]